MQICETEVQFALPDKLEKEFGIFVELHQNQLVSSGVPRIYWRTLFKKLTDTIFDAGENFSFLQLDQEEDDDDEEIPRVKVNPTRCNWKVVVADEQGIEVEDRQHIYLIDHAWTYRVSTAKEQLRTIPKLLDRMAGLMDIDPIATEGQSKEKMVEEVWKEMWRFNQCYSLGGKLMDAEDQVPVWYIMDEFGSRIQHSEEPNFRIVPFLYHMDQSYSLLFPIQNATYGEEVTRDYLEGPPVDPITRFALSIPWETSDLTHVNCNVKEPDEDYIRSSRIEETYPTSFSVVPILDPTKKYKVYADYSVIRNNLNHRCFEIVSDEKEADILWLNYHFKDYMDLYKSTPEKFVNQFPFEHVLTTKDLLSGICRRLVPAGSNVIDPRSLRSLPKWLPTTFNLKTELPQFVSYYQQRQRRRLDNIWIIKPWNLARSLDTHITSNLNYIIRLPASGPKIACKYITNPVLFPRSEIGLVKFDVRYIILLRSVKPLVLYVYNKFWLRFANRPFSLDNFDEYEKHFTVMNYSPGAELNQMFCDDFIKRFEAVYPKQKWANIEKEIHSILRSVFEAATSQPPPCGIAPNLQSRAMYAVDLMLQWDREQKTISASLLEVNWCPDCERACQYYPEFFNDVFATLFLDQVKNSILIS